MCTSDETFDFSILLLLMRLTDKIFIGDFSPAILFVVVTLFLKIVVPSGSL